MDAGSKAPLVPVTSTDHAGYIIVTIYGALFTTAVFWLVRLVFRFQKLRPRWDDGFLICSMLFAILQTVCMQLSTSAGLGKQKRTLEHGDSWEKSFFAAQLLNVLSQLCSKLSVSLLFQSFQPFKGISKANKASLVLHTAWLVASVIALALQCGPPNPWHLRADRCVSLRSLELGIDLVNIFSEVCLIALPTALMPQVQTTVQIQILVIVCFACRTAVIGTLGGHISSLHHLEIFDDPSWSYTMPAIWSQVVMNVSILTAAIPGMQQFLADLRPGMTTLTVRDAHQETSNSASVFGANSRARATAYSDSKGNSWELSKLDSVMRSKGGTRQERRHSESESVERLTPHPNNIVVTREFVSYIED
ncbi:hypothetical protein LTR78_006694 [Recurvomyces mirabilis]|uniref:Rhodopsin domain-containing protein n=1 Tax=Recurvomyces mirabilis TaxID=574656 RepID=A0AAE1BZL3_9PEZI|nr:hypothetical protein LTR78_006694 [Recurvomyces mirabilis]KAK5151416.1 hypothetical protein LTS14_009259 [Recurvomyces mirabilis]